jgi:hypothetical protein
MNGQVAPNPIDRMEPETLTAQSVLFSIINLVFMDEIFVSPNLRKIFNVSAGKSGTRCQNMSKLMHGMKEAIQHPFARNLKPDHLYRS